MKIAALALLVFALPLVAQVAPTGPAAPLRSLAFLEGTWEAKSQAGSAGATSSGTYTFKRELGDHILARSSHSSACRGPETFDCEHRDLLYVFEDAPGAALKAIYFDNEGHVIHYDVSTPTSTSAIFLSEASRPGPQFRLIYDLKDGMMTGKFQMRMPGQTEWKSYLEWNGSRVKQ
jgi:hypothetical protein